MNAPELEMQVDELCNMITSREPTEDEVYDIYCWIDSLNFTRTKKNISRDFSDGVLMAELIKFYIPSAVDINNYYSASSKKNKENNWDRLMTTAFQKLGYRMPKQRVNDIMDSKPGAIEKALFDLRPVVARKNRSILNYRMGKEPEVVEEPKPKSGRRQMSTMSRRGTLPIDESRRDNELVKPVEEKIVVEAMKPPRGQKRVTIEEAGHPSIPAAIKKNVVGKEEAKPVTGRGNIAIDDSKSRKQGTAKSTEEKVPPNLTLSITVDSKKDSDLNDIKNRNIPVRETTTKPPRLNEAVKPERRQMRSPPSPSASHGFEEQVLFNTNRMEMENAPGSGGGFFNFFGLI